jgi:carbon monoxide dehydrogenase subunit G
VQVEITGHVAAEPALVWDVLVDWERQAEWMVDAEAVEVTTPHRRGEGVQLRCPTRILGVTVEDSLEVGGWDEPRALTVRHLGPLIRGRGFFLLVPEGDGTRVVWREDIDKPLGPLGRLGAAVVRPYVRRTLSRSLSRLTNLCEEAAGGQL